MRWADAGERTTAWRDRRRACRLGRKAMGRLSALKRFLAEAEPAEAEARAMRHATVRRHDSAGAAFPGWAAFGIPRSR
jgi:hypothetical protein